MKRYLVTLDLYVYAEDDTKAKEEARVYTDYLKLSDDNKARVVSIHESPFGKIGCLREVEK